MCGGLTNKWVVGDVGVRGGGVGCLAGGGKAGGEAGVSGRGRGSSG